MAGQDLHEVIAEAKRANPLYEDIVYRCWGKDPFEERVEERSLWDVMDDFPGNRRTAQPAKGATKKRAPTAPKEPTAPSGEVPKEVEKEVKKVIEGGVTEKKRFGNRLRKVFFGGGLHSTTDYILTQILLPAARDMAVNAVSGGIERIVYGDQAQPGVRRGPGGRGGKVHYGGPGGPMGPIQRPFLPGQSQTMRNSTNPAEESYFDTRLDAERVLEGLILLIQQYEVATAGDFKKMVGNPTSFVDDQWGWWNIHQMGIQQTRDGWRVVLPDPEPI